MALVEMSMSPDAPARLAVEVAESEGVVRLWFDGARLEDLSLDQATQGAACVVDRGETLGVRVEVRVGRPRVVATLDDAPLVITRRPTEVPGARVALAALVTIVAGVLEAVGGALFGGLNLLLVIGLVTAALGVALLKRPDSGVAVVGLWTVAAALVVQVGLLFLFTEVPAWVFVAPATALAFVARAGRA